jgi:hypothetical protein
MDGYHMETHCLLCSKKFFRNGYCEIHSQAYEILKNTYQVWLKAYDNKLRFKDYLNTIYNLRETGEAVKEVIDNINSREKD